MNEELNELQIKLNDKIEFEYNEYYKEMMEKNPEEILKNAYEYTMKTEIYEQLSYKKFDEVDLEVLLKNDNLIDNLYQYYKNSDLSISYLIEDTISDFIIDKIKEVEQKNEVKKEKEAR